MEKKLNFFQLLGKIISPALISALTSLAITSYVENKNREIILRPYVQADISVNRSNPKSSQFGIVINNLGKGAAIIEKSIVYIGDKKFLITYKDFSQVMRKIISELDLDNCKEFFLVDFTPSESVAIGENQTYNLLTIPEQASDIITFQQVGIFADAGMIEIEALKQFKSTVIKRYETCRKTLIQKLSDHNTNLSMEIQYRSLNDDKLYGKGVLISLKTSQPLYP